MTCSDSDAPTPLPLDPRQPPAPRRVIWVAAGRGDVLLLGPLFQDFSRRRERGIHHWFQDTGEAGMAAYQARDYLSLIPDETGDLCHPADEPAVRLAHMIERVESFVRRMKGTHVVFSGFGPTAAASAIYCHARGCRGLWLRPPDPAGLAGRLRWEAGLERLIRACAPCVQDWQIPGVPDFRRVEAGEGSVCLEREIPGLRAGAPLVTVTVLRRDWGYLDDATSRLARAAAGWAAAHPAADFLIVSNLNARLEGPVRSLEARPANLLLAPPLPYPVYRAVLDRSQLLLTDAPLIAAEAMALGVPTATLGERPFASPATLPDWHQALIPSDLECPAWLERLGERFGSPLARPSRAAGMEEMDPVFDALRRTLEGWLSEGA